MKHTSKHRAALGDGPIANTTAGGHQMLVDDIPFPRWIVSHDPQTKRPTGIIVDLSTKAVARWIIVEKNSAITRACAAGFALADGHLVILPRYSIGKREQMTPGKATEMIAPVLDYLFDPSRPRTD